MLLLSMWYWSYFKSTFLAIFVLYCTRPTSDRPENVNFFSKGINEIRLHKKLNFCCLSLFNSRRVEIENWLKVGLKVIWRKFFYFQRSKFRCLKKLLRIKASVAGKKKRLSLTVQLLLRNHTWKVQINNMKLLKYKFPVMTVWNFRNILEFAKWIEKNV